MTLCNTSEIARGHLFCLFLFFKLIDSAIVKVEARSVKVEVFQFADLDYVVANAPTHQVDWLTIVFVRDDKQDVFTL